jgi:hypothetical protein
MLVKVGCWDAEMVGALSSVGFVGEVGIVPLIPSSSTQPHSFLPHTTLLFLILSHLSFLHIIPLSLSNTTSFLPPLYNLIPPSLIHYSSLLYITFFFPPYTTSFLHTLYNLIPPSLYNLIPPYFIQPHSSLLIQPHSFIIFPSSSSPIPAPVPPFLHTAAFFPQLIASFLSTVLFAGVEWQPCRG